LSVERDDATLCVASRREARVVEERQREQPARLRLVGGEGKLAGESDRLAGQVHPARVAGRVDEVEHGQRDAGELDRQITAQDVVQARAETDNDLWVIGIADHHGAPVVSNDRFDEYRARFPWLRERRVAVVLADHAALLQGDALDGSGRPPESPAALREEIERLRQSAAAAQSRVEDVVALRGRVARLEGHLARQPGRSDCCHGAATTA